MAINSLGDLATAFILRRQSAEAKSQIQTLSSELTSGLALDRAAHLSGNLAPLAGIESSLAKLKGFSNAARDLNLTAGAMQLALSSIGGQTLDLSGRLLTAATTKSETQIDAVAQASVSQLTSVVAALNTRFGDRSLFSGTATNQAAMIPADELLTLLEGVVAGATGSAQAEGMIAAWFDDPGGFAAQAYLGADPQDPIAVAPGEVAQLDLTLMNPAILDTLKALALPALMTRGLLAGQSAGQADITKRSGERLLELQTSWTEVAAKLGTTEAQLGSALARNSAEYAALEIARVDLIGVDPFETATRLEAVQTQLETMYALTARMQRLNLADYL